MADIICKGLSKPECEFPNNPNCNWRGNRGCIRRDGVNDGLRYAYNSSGNPYVYNVIIPSRVPVNNPPRVPRVPVNNPPRIPVNVPPIPPRVTVNVPPIPPRVPVNVRDITVGMKALDMFEYNPDFDNPVQEIQRKKLGSGGYGITFIPALDCTNGQKYPRSLGKVFTDEVSANEEWEIIQKIKKIENPKQNYFIYPTFRCNVPFDYRSNDPIQKELATFVQSKFKDSNGNPKNLSFAPLELPQHVMEYNGSTLKDYITTHYNSKTLGRVECIVILENLFYGIKRLNENGYIHCDIKPANIVVSNKKRLRIIDFGLTLKINDFNSAWNNLLMQVAYYSVGSPETILVTQNLGTYTYQDYVDNLFFKDWYHYFTHDVTNPDDYKNRFNELLNDMKRGKFKIFDDKKTVLAQDPYSIGCVIVAIAHTHALKSSANENPEVVKLFRELVRGLLDPRPAHRTTINEAIVIIKKLKTFPHDNPFEKNKDSHEMNVLMQFGKSQISNKLRVIHQEIKYLSK